MQELQIRIMIILICILSREEEGVFLNREPELSELDRLYRSERAELYVLYGRRRVGKTELLREFCKDKPHLFFVSTLSSDSHQLASFSQQIWAYTHSQVSEGFTFPSWEAAFRGLIELPGRPVVVQDEFTYLISGNKAIPSILQKVWDEGLKNSRVFLILCGSYVGMMEREVLAYRAPLYGRRTASRYLQPVDLPSAAEFFPSYSPVQQIEAWSVLGGMPYYLQVFSDSVGLYTNIRRHILDNQGRLYNEPRLVLMEELREPRNYFAIMRAIAQGRTRLNEIAQASGVGNGSKTARYLSILQELRLVSRRVPATERQPEKSKKGIYEFTDPFLRFWFRYVHPNIGSLELGLAEAVLAERVRPTFAAFAGRAFEEAARDYVARLARGKALRFVPDRIGSWWDRQAEIDVMAVGENEKAILLGECKWSSRPLGIRTLQDLQSKARALPDVYQRMHVSYALFSKRGFTNELRKLARQQGVLLVTPDDLTVRSKA